MSQEYEFTLVQKQNVRMYKIPPMSNASGYLLGQWKELIWNGRLEFDKGSLKTITIGQVCTTKFLNADGTEFARAVIAENIADSVQKCVDSSRGYAIKLTAADGRAMWVGLGFHDRNDAFDFYDSYKEYSKKLEMERNPHLFKETRKDVIDFSLKPGQVIVMNISENSQAQNSSGNGPSWDNPFEKGPNNAGTKQIPSFTSTGYADSLKARFDFGLPPSDTQTSKKDDDWGNFGGSGTSNGWGNQAAAQNNDWFGGNKVQSNTQSYAAPQTISTDWGFNPSQTQAVNQNKQTQNAPKASDTNKELLELDLLG